jgi:uncharacterized membrane protein
MTRRTVIFEGVLIALALSATLILYPRIPAEVPTHWNAHMQPNQFSAKGYLFLFGPGFMAGAMALTWLLPWLSPKRFEMGAFRATYQRVMLLVFSLMAYLYAMMLYASFGRTVDSGRAILCGVCLFLAAIGNMMGKFRRNFYIGVRTPWTIANERVWNATHRFAGVWMVVGGLAGLVLALLGLSGLALAAILAPALAAVLYSLWYYKKLERRGELDGETRVSP